ncbi:MAG: hypothetical protein NTU62_02065 [Spirochaetes bacterium]|nr:hypothetical protein [Spirochaetota bacterium]
MSLLEKASAFARAKSLLHRSLELLSEEPSSAPAGPAEPSVFDVPVFRIRVKNTEPEKNPESAPAPSRTAPPVPSAAADPAAFTEELAGEVASLEPTIDLPSRLFGLLKDRLGIAKGALLLHDTVRQVFAPWAAAGYDAATLRRLRIPPEGTVFGRLVGSLPVEVSDPKGIADLRRFFSSRESGNFERLLLAPFSAGDRLLGALLVSQIAPPIPAGSPLTDCLARAAAAALPALQRLRDEILRPGRAGPVSPREAREDLTRFLAAHTRGTQPFTVFPLSLERCRKRVISANPWFDPFRLEEDLRSVVSGFTADLGRAVHLGRLRFLVAVRDLSAADTDLFVHQLASLLGSLFHATSFEPADAEVGTARTFPDGAEGTPEAAAELLASLAAS